jgi:predicted adenylyl cyclase CyaB
LQVLGFQHVGDVIKSRRTAVIPWTGWDVVMALDEVVSLGCYVELETICLAGKLKDAEQVIDRIATELGLFSTERASYLELLVGEG